MAQVIISVTDFICQITPRIDLIICRSTIAARFNAWQSNISYSEESLRLSSLTYTDQFRFTIGNEF